MLIHMLIAINILLFAKNVSYHFILKDHFITFQIEDHDPVWNTF